MRIVLVRTNNELIAKGAIKRTADIYNGSFCLANSESFHIQMHIFNPKKANITEIDIHSISCGNQSKVLKAILNLQQSKYAIGHPRMIAIIISL